MIIGNGDIASVLQFRSLLRNDLLLFASGVSNSQETRESEYQREKDLLAKQAKDLRIVYFSSLGVLDGDSRYYRHKREMEELVISHFPKYCIIRIGNITWGNNPHTIINAMKAMKKKGEKLIIRDECRYLVGKEEFIYWIDRIPKWNCEISIPGKRMTVKKLVEKYVL